MRSRTTKLIAATWILVSLPGQVMAEDVTLVRDGRPAAVIVVEKDAPPAVRLAAVELQHHIEQITGVALPFAEPDRPIQGARILVGESAATRALGLSSESFAPQEYLIRIAGDTIVLMGRDWKGTEADRQEIARDTQMRSLDSWRKKIDYDQAVGRSGRGSEGIELPGPLDDQGTCYAAYDFLERFCDVRWYGPTPLGVVTPSSKTLAVPAGEVRRSPSLAHRYGEGGNWPLVRAQWNKPNEAQSQLFYRRLRLGGEKWAGNHSFSSFERRFLKPGEKNKLWERSRPDFFAVGWEQEGHWRQLCLTNPDLVQQVAQDARDYFDGKGLKGEQPACGDYFAVIPNDSDHWCKCEPCQAVLAPGKSRDVPGSFNTGTASDYVFGFVNAVAKEVGKTHPDKYIATLAYHVYAYPPTFALEPNVAVAPCVITCYGYTKLIDNDKKFYAEWTAEPGRRLHVWNYFHHPMEVAIMQGWNCFPSFMPDVITDWVRRYERDGVRGFYLCGIGEQVDYYLYMQLAFNTQLDEKALIHEFFSRYFGAAGEPLERFYYRISEINREERRIGTSEEASWGRLGTEERMAELGALMERAVSLASTDLERRRVATWKEGVWDYMVQGRRLYVKKKRAHEQKAVPLPVYGTGVDDEGKLLPERVVDLHWRLVQSGDSDWTGPKTYAADSNTPATPAGEQASTASKWVVPHPELLGVAPGDYVYEQTFALEGVDLETASIVGRIMADDEVKRIELNGKNVGQAGAGFASWRDFVIMDHFVEGVNTLRIVVKNHGTSANPHGLRVELRGSADKPR